MPARRTVFQLHIALDDVTPTVWRRLLVPGSGRLSVLHGVLQEAMGWGDSHLHAFVIGHDRYGVADDEADEDELDESDVSITAAIGDNDRFRYLYDFGDGWEHEVTVEERRSVTHALRSAVCLDGANACPPEDCGGPGGYADLVEALADPDHEQHEELLEWFGGPLDPTDFDIVAINAALQRVR